MLKAARNYDNEPCRWPVSATHKGFIFSRKSMFSSLGCSVKTQGKTHLLEITVLIANCSKLKIFELQ